MPMADRRPSIQTYAQDRARGIGLARGAIARRPDVRVRAVASCDAHDSGVWAHDGGVRAIAEQCRHALRHGVESLARAGLRMEDVVHVTYTVRNPDAFPACFPLLRHAFGDARPMVTLHLVGAADHPAAQIEIELLARHAIQESG